MDWLLTDREILETAKEIGTSVYPLGNSDTEKYMNWQRTIWYEIARAQVRKVTEWGDEICTDKEHLFRELERRLCPHCWQSLKKEYNR